MSSFLDPNKESLFGSDTLGTPTQKGGSPFSDRAMQQNMITSAETEEEISYNLTFGESLWDILAGTGSGLISGATFGLVDLYDPKRR